MSEAPLSGAQFARQVGTDPEKWAARFLTVYAEADGVRTDADRLAFVASWFRDAMDAAVRAVTSELDLGRAPLASGVSEKPSK